MSKEQERDLYSELQKRNTRIGEWFRKNKIDDRNGFYDVHYKLDVKKEEEGFSVKFGIGKLDRGLCSAPFYEPSEFLIIYFDIYGEFEYAILQKDSCYTRHLQMTGLHQGLMQIALKDSLYLRENFMLDKKQRQFVGGRGVFV